MNQPAAVPGSIDEYIAGFPESVRLLLAKVRATIRDAAPEAVEKISYRMPAFEQHGILVYFGAFSQHIGLFPTARGIAAFSGELSGYRSSKGGVQFPLDKPIPYELIKRIVKFRIAENMAKSRRGR